MQVVETRFRAPACTLWEGAAMPQNLTEEISECLRHADLCNLMAKTARNPSAIQDYLEMEQRWLQLARSYEFTGRLSTLANRAQGRRGDGR